MKKAITKVVLSMALAALAPASRAQTAADAWSGSPDDALFQSEVESNWRISVSYAHRMRPIRFSGKDWTISGESIDGALTFDWGWGTVSAFGGGTQAHLKERGLDDLDMEPGGGAALHLNLWGLEPARRVPWDLMIGLDARGEWRRTSDDFEKLEWGEGFAALPVAWRLYFENPRRTRRSDFHALTLYAGPAGDTLQGRRTLSGHRTTFHETDSFGAVGGVDLWLLDCLRFGARLEYFGDITWSLAAEYAF